MKKWHEKATFFVVEIYILMGIGAFFGFGVGMIVTYYAIN